MDSKNMSKVGVIGAGSFGTAIANLLAERNQVLLYVRNPETLASMKETGTNRGQTLHENIAFTADPAYLCDECILIYPMVASKGFRSMCQQFNPLFRPDHIIIHGTKGLSITPPDGWDAGEDIRLDKKYIHTMTEVIRQETNVLRVGCLSGPNLAGELSEKKPAATVIASRFDEVIDAGKNTIRSERFRVYSSNDVLGVELSGVLKNIMAIASGMLDGLGLGINTRSLLITRALGEMVKIGKVLGSDADAFLGMAGIGDLIATCSSPKSRNFTVGRRLASGETLESILTDMNEVVEGVRTAKTAYAVSRQYKIHTPIIESVYNILYNDMAIQEAMSYLMTHGYDRDADFLDML